MIDSLDLVIRHTLLADIPALAGRIGFQPPDDRWRQRVGAAPGIWLNCALVDLREDRKNRQSDFRVERDPLRRIHPHFLMRCHYLLSAWNSAKDSDAVAATEQEHGLLGRVVATLVERAPLEPASVLVPAELASLPAAWREISLDTDVLPAEGFPKIAEFWGTMGRSAPWRPVSWLVVTVPIASTPTPFDDVVTTVMTSLGQQPAGAWESFLSIGGLVLDGSGPHAGAPVPVDEAIVTASDTAGRPLARAFTSYDGRFVLDGLTAGTYRLTARAAALPPLAPVDVTLPAPAAGPFELQFT